jgi:hypothetical protein
VTRAVELLGSGTIRDSRISSSDEGVLFGANTDGYYFMSSLVTAGRGVVTGSSHTGTLRANSVNIRATTTGLQIWGGNARFTNSTIIGSTNTVNTSFSTGTVFIGLSEVAGGPVLVNAGTVTGAGNVDENGVFFPNSVP